MHTIVSFYFQAKNKKENEHFFAQISGIKLTRKVYFYIYISKHGRKFFTSTLCFFRNLNELEETSLMQLIK